MRGTATALLFANAMNVLFIVAALFMWLEALIVFGEWTGWPLGWRVIWLAAPWPQLWLFRANLRLAKSGEPSRALKNSVAQFAIVGVLYAAYVAWVFR